MGGENMVYSAWLLIAFALGAVWGIWINKGGYWY